MNNLSQLPVCFLAGTLGRGGAEQQLYYMVRALLSCGAKPRVLSFGQNEFWETPLQQLGVAISFIGTVPSRFSRLLRLLKHLRRERPLILQSQHFFTNAYTALAARVFKIAGIGALRSNGLMEALDCGQFGGFLNLRLPKVLAANSRAAIGYAAGSGVPASRLYYLSNVVDADQWRLAKRSDSQPFTLMTAGRLVPVKRLERFLALLANLRHQRQLDIHGIIVGDGPLRAVLEEQAQQMGLLPQVLRFMGHRTDLSSCYRAADLFVLTSDHEGTPNVVLEAMASGLPVVATRVGGLPEVVQPGRTGFLVETERLEELPSLVVQVLTDASLRRALGHNARAYVQAHHSLESLPGRLSGLYALALRNSPPKELPTGAPSPALSTNVG